MRRPGNRLGTRMTPESALDITQWVVSEGLKGSSETEILAGFCQRLVTDGMPLLRANLSQPTLHPIVGGHNFIWWRDEETAVEEDWRRSFNMEGVEASRIPFSYMASENLWRMRHRLGPGATPTQFPLLERFAARGGTDYFALAIAFGTARRLGPADRILSSWVSDASDGFDENHIAVIEQLAQPLALAVKNASAYRIANSVIATYLGADAGRRVLEGEIVRGTGETIRAALWFCDLEGFTKIADTAPRDQLLGMLDDYFECMVTAVHEHGGQVLKFMGDGLLAIFKGDSVAASCDAALDAADLLLRQMSRVTANRASENLPVTGFRVALHLGDVMYGNIGAHDRLDFTVVGPAVNEVSRIEAMCRSLEQTLAISSAFAEGASRSRERLVSLGRYALRGVRRPQELFTLFTEEEDEAPIKPPA
jgi:adenylate cyclase